MSKNDSQPANAPNSNAAPPCAGLNRRQLLVLAGEACAVGALAACGGTEDTTMMMASDGTCMGTAATTGVLATGAEALQVGQAKSFPSPDPKAYLSFFVARDAVGFYALRNVCAHAGCQTNFVASTSSFDCPCHGSRYHFDGTLLQGPAAAGLKSFAICRNTDGKLVVAVDDFGSTDLSQRIK